MNKYESARANFIAEHPEKFNFAGDVIDGWASNPDKLAIRWLDDQGSDIDYTFAQLSENSRRVCNLLSTAGVKSEAIPLFWCWGVSWPGGKC